MTIPVVRKGTVLQTSGLDCPRACRTGANGTIHLMSDHSEETARQCSKCACVVQSVPDRTQLQT